MLNRLPVANKSLLLWACFHIYVAVLCYLGMTPFLEPSRCHNMESDWHMGTKGC